MACSVGGSPSRSRSASPNARSPSLPWVGSPRSHSRSPSRTPALPLTRSRSPSPPYTRNQSQDVPFTSRMLMSQMPEDTPSQLTWSPPRSPVRSPPWQLPLLQPHSPPRMQSSPLPSTLIPLDRWNDGTNGFANKSLSSATPGQPVRSVIRRASPPSRQSSPPTIIRPRVHNYPPPTQSQIYSPTAYGSTSRSPSPSNVNSFTEYLFDAQGPDDSPSPRTLHHFGLPARSSPPAAQNRIRSPSPHQSPPHRPPPSRHARRRPHPTAHSGGAGAKRRR